MTATSGRAFVTGGLTLSRVTARDPKRILMAESLAVQRTIYERLRPLIDGARERFARIHRP